MLIPHTLCRQVTKEQNADVKRLLGLMGVPVVEAPCEAEAQCAALVRAKKVSEVVVVSTDFLFSARIASVIFVLLLELRPSFFLRSGENFQCFILSGLWDGNRRYGRINLWF